ncbi:MAG: hypothetical protein IAI50_14135 [Candidatus Eremiobacteraeota bacterium]|nr:hypothetical protein [Candidatus Eremiobacteraeota bacterium]
MIRRKALLLATLALVGARSTGAVLDVRVVSGTPQTSLAYAASTEPGYVTTFAQPLVVRVAGMSATGGKVRYRCVSPHCRFAVSTQPDDVERIDPQTYEVRLRRASASLRPTLGTDAPGTFAIDVRPVLHDGERAAGVARFTLTAR